MWLLLRQIALWFDCWVRAAISANGSFLNQSRLSSYNCPPNDLVLRHYIFVEILDNYTSLYTLHIGFGWKVLWLIEYRDYFPIDTFTDVDVNYMDSSCGHMNKNQKNISLDSWFYFVFWHIGELLLVICRKWQKKKVFRNFYEVYFCIIHVVVAFTYFKSAKSQNDFLYHTTLIAEMLSKVVLKRKQIESSK